MELLEAVPREESDVTPEPGAAKRVKLRNSLLLTDFSPSSELALPLCRGFGSSVQRQGLCRPCNFTRNVRVPAARTRAPDANRDSELWTATNATTAYPSRTPAGTT